MDKLERQKKVLYTHQYTDCWLVHSRVHQDMQNWTLQIGRRVKICLDIIFGNQNIFFE